MTASAAADGIADFHDHAPATAKRTAHAHGDDQDATANADA